MTTNNSLREEIYKHLFWLVREFQMAEEENKDLETLREFHTDKLINIFEKRIDVRIIQVNDQPLFNIAFRQGYNTALDWVKKEMLK